MGANAQTSVPTFTAGQILTAAQMNNSARTGVPVFATTTTRDAAFGSSPLKTLAQGQLCYIEATNVVQYYNGTAWLTLAPLIFNTIANITATNASWPIPTLLNPIVKVTVIGAGGGGGGGNNSGTGGNGGNSTFVVGATTITGTGGTGGVNGPSTGATAAQAATAGVASNNGGTTPGGNTYFGSDGSGGQITVAYVNLTGFSTANITIGAGGAGAGSSSSGGRGEVRVEYAA